MHSTQKCHPCSAKVLPKGTIVITARGTVGEFCILGEDMAFNQSCYGLVMQEDINKDFIYYKLKVLLGQIDALSYGSVFDTITMRTFDEIKLKLPPKNEQKAIANIFSTLDKKIELNNQMNETLEEMAQAIYKS